MIAAPATAPRIQILGMGGRTIHLQLSDSDVFPRRGKPHGVASANVFWFVSEQEPAEPSDWSLAGASSRADLSLTLANEVKPGTRIWLTAQWLNPRSQAGPLAQPVHTYAGGGVMFRLAA